MTQQLSRKEFLKIAASGAVAVSSAANAQAADTPRSFVPELFFASPIPNGFTWTLASRLWDMLSLAEELLGPRDMTYTILGVEIGPDIPRIWYPGNRKNVIVQLSPAAANDAAKAWYELAHETVHLLAPTAGGPATNLEEAVACYFAAYYMKKRLAQPSWRPVEPSYTRILDLIAPRMDQDIYCVNRLRSVKPSFAEIAREKLSAEFPGLAPADLNFLLAKFNRAG